MAGSKGRSGGQRSGAGRRPQSARVLALHGGQDRGVVRPAPAVVAPVACPEGVAPPVAAVWADLAGHAVSAGTLVPGTASAFLRLCESIVKHAQMEAAIALDGLTCRKVMRDEQGQVQTIEVKAHPLLSRAQTLDNAIRAGMKDFAINPFGKPLTDPRAQAVDPFDEFERVG